MFALRASGSTVSAPASRTSRSSRAASSRQLSWSHVSIAASSASHSQRKPRGVLAAERLHAPASAAGAAARVPVDEHRGEAVEQQVGSARRWRSRGRARGLRDLERGAVGEPAGELGRRSAPPGRSRARAARRAARAAGRRSSSSAGASLPRFDVNVISARSRCALGALERVERPGLRAGQQRERRLGRARLVLGLRRRQRPPRALRRVGRERGRPLEERRGRREPAARLRAPGRVLELRGHLPRPRPPPPARDATRAGRRPRPGR